MNRRCFSYQLALFRVICYPDHPMEIKLNEIAAVLEGLEETIIHRIIDRGQYRSNDCVYEPGKSGFSGGRNMSLLDIRLKRQEEMDSEFGRFSVPEERPFRRDLPKPKRRLNPAANPLEIDDYNRINLTSKVFFAYCSMISRFCEPGDDGQYGSAVELDVAALQAVSRRVHFGSFYIAESKYQAEPVKYGELIAAGDTAAIVDLLTRKEVEDQILKRLKVKVDSIQSRINTLVRRQVDPEAIIEFYRRDIIPLTKEGEILYLFHRNRT